MDTPIGREQHEPFKVLPTWGELLHRPRPHNQIDEDLASCSSSGLAGTLHDVLNSAQTGERYSLSLVPCFVPMASQGGDLSFGKHEVATIRRFVRNYSSYNEVFRPGGLIGKMDTLVVAAGSAKDRMPGLFWNPEIIRQSGINEKRLRRAVVGDVGGVLLPRAGLERNSEEFAHLLDVIKRWNGLRLSDIEACATKNSRNTGNSPAGVIVLVCGMAKADIALQAVRHGLVNHLFTDIAYAKAMNRLAEQQKALTPLSPTQNAVMDSLRNAYVEFETTRKKDYDK
jgi:hypothetical protein